MYRRLIAALDGSSRSEEVLPYVRQVSEQSGAGVLLLRAVKTPFDTHMAHSYLTRIAAGMGVATEIKVAEGSVSDAIVAELEEQPESIAGLTSHGYSGLREKLMGDVALNVVRSVRKPTLVYRPTGETPEIGRIREIVVSLEGSPLSESILPSAVELASSIDAKLTLVQVVQPLVHPVRAASLVSAGGIGQITLESPAVDVFESSYLRSVASNIGSHYGVTADWEALHGNPADAVCGYISGRQDVVLAFTAHGRGGLDLGILGSVAANYVRNAGVPMLLNWPR